MAKTDIETEASTHGLPVRATVADVEAVCTYLAKKPTGATQKEIRAVVDAKSIEARRINAMKRWGLLEENGDRLRLLERGRLVAKDGGVHRARALAEALREVEPYRATVERAAHKREFIVSATDAAAHWHDNFRGQASSGNETLNEQVLCFFQLAEGADLGRIVIGRRGQPTRFEFDAVLAEKFADGASPAASSSTAARSAESGPDEGQSDDEAPDEEMAQIISHPASAAAVAAQQAANVSRVFVTHGKNTKVLDQVKRLLKVAKFEAVVAQERETPAKPVPEKVMDDMRSCHAAVIHVGSEGVWTDAEGNTQVHINPNVLIEIGAAMALYNRRFILLVEDGVKLPSNLQGLYECRYKGDELSLDGAMKLVEALNNLR
jgi:predicted nucleotide-binding protein